MRAAVYGALVIMLVWPCVLRAGDVAVTSVTVTGATAAITFNRVLRISGIGLERAGGRTSLVFPRSVSRRGRVFPQVKLLTRQADEAVRDAIEQGAASGAADGTLTYRIAACTIFKKKSRLKGVAAVRFNDAVEVECKLVDGRNGTWILWPESRRRGGKKGAAQVVVFDKRLKESIEQDILERLREMACEGENDDE